MSTITKNFTKIWLAERSLIYVTATNGATYCDLYNGDTRLARYTLNAAHRVTIDITDYMRAYPSTQSLKVQIAGESAVTVTTPYGGLINPESMIIPAHTLLPNWKIVPPSMILQDIGVPTVFWAHGFDDYANYFTDKTEGAPYIDAGGNEMPQGSTWLQIDIEQDYYAKINLKPLQCGKRYAAVEWVASSGATLRHTFEVKGLKSSIYGAFSLQTLDNSYNTIKGREEAVELFLDGLTAYDLWYYSDIITSPSVRVSLDGVNWRQVDVVTDSQSIPDGDAGEFYKLSVSVNYRKYDAV